MQLVQEVRGGELYEYYPLDEHVVVAPDICGGRPTFKYTRLEVDLVLPLLAAGQTIEQVVQAYSLSHLSLEAVQEAIRLAGHALVKTAEGLQPAAA